MEISDQQIIKIYSELKSVWQTGKAIGISGQSVHKKLKALGILMDGHGRNWTDNDTNRLKEIYSGGFNRGNGKLDALCLELGRTKQFISRKARSLGLSNIKRRMSKNMKASCSENSREWHKKNEHPRGYLNHRHSDTTKKKLGIRSKQAWANYDDNKRAELTLRALKTKHRKGILVMPRKKVSWKGGNRTIGGNEKYYRSRWEANYARYLEFLKLKNEIKDWAHEADVFWFEKIKRGVRSFLPDFKVTENNNSIFYHEVKGWMDNRSKTKIKRMKIYYPEVKLLVIDSKSYLALEKKISYLIPGWEMA